MNTLTLVVGGSRSGKSAFAQRQAELHDSPRLFIATSPRIDPEMTERIRLHRQEREGRGWQTAEVPLLLAKQLRQIPAGTTVLIDCLTLWVSNMIYEAELHDREVGEDQVVRLAEELVLAARDHEGGVIMVTNEVGMGLVPDNLMARRFRDLAGRCNQVVAAAVDDVFFVSCGIPLHIKGGEIS